MKVSFSTPLAASPDSSDHEVCGLLLGRRGSDVAHVDALFSTPNRARRPARAFAIGPQDFLAARHAAASAELEVVGVFHSHPHGTARPSARDAAFAALWPGLLWVIRGADAGLAAFRFDPSAGGWLGVPVVSSATP